MAAYWKMFEPRVPGLRAHPDLLPVPRPGRQARRDGRPDGRAPSSRRPSCARGRTRWPPSSPSRSTAAAASSTRPTTTSRSCARSATGTRSCSSPTRSSPASAGRASGSRLAHWNVTARHLLVRQGRDLRLPAAGRHHGEPRPSRTRSTASSPRTAGCTPTRTRAIRPAARSRSRTSRSWSASGCGRTRPRWATACTRGCSRPSAITRTRATSAAARGCWPRVELVEDRPTKKNLAADQKVAPRLQAEMMKRGVITRVRPVAGAHPAPGDTVYFAPPLVVTDAGGRPAGVGDSRRGEGRARRLSRAGEADHRAPDPDPLRHRVLRGVRGDQDAEVPGAGDHRRPRAGGGRASSSRSASSGYFRSLARWGKSHGRRARHAHLRRRVRDVPGERAVAHAAGRCRPAARDPALPIERAPARASPRCTEAACMTAMQLVLPGRRAC